MWMELVIILCFCCTCASAENVPKPASARKTPAKPINRPIKTRRLRKADCEADFFFIGSSLALVEAPRAYQRGFLLLGFRFRVSRVECRFYQNPRERVNTIFGSFGCGLRC